MGTALLVVGIIFGVWLIWMAIGAIFLYAFRDTTWPEKDKRDQEEDDLPLWAKVIVLLFILSCWPVILTVRDCPR